MEACKFISTCIIVTNYLYVAPFPALHISYIKDSVNKPENINSSNQTTTTVLKATQSNESNSRTTEEKYLLKQFVGASHSETNATKSALTTAAPTPIGSRDS
jgi:hypothetical protein